jgi:hypothetical protein
MAWKSTCRTLTADVLHLSPIQRPFDLNSSNSRLLHEKNPVHHHHHHPSHYLGQPKVLGVSYQPALNRHDTS